MTNDDDMMIRRAARSLCAIEAADQHNDEDFLKYLSGDLDDTVWMRLVERGVRQGIRIGRAL